MDKPEAPSGNGPSTVGEAWVHSINPVDLFKDANESSNNWLPLGIGFAIDHPSALASPEFLEMAALDPVFRVGKAAWEVGAVTPYNMLQDVGSAAKDVVDASRDFSYAPIDLLTLHPISALEDLGHGIVDVAKAIGHTGEAVIIEPLKGLWNGVRDLI